MHLPSLTELSVQVCEGIKELFTEEDGEIQRVSEAPSFPSLRSLTLEHSLNLVSMSNLALDFPLLCSFPIFNCPNLKRLAFKPDIVNKEFVQIHCVKEWWERLEWEDDTIQSFLSRFINFIEISHYLSTVSTVFFLIIQSNIDAFIEPICILFQVPIYIFNFSYLKFQ